MQGNPPTNDDEWAFWDSIFNSVISGCAESVAKQEMGAPEAIEVALRLTSLALEARRASGR